MTAVIKNQYLLKTSETERRWSSCGIQGLKSSARLHKHMHPISVYYGFEVFK
jgi:hypothetical protein